MEFWRFIGSEEALGPSISHGHHDPLLVAMSIVVACLAGYSSLSIVDRIRLTKSPRARSAWLAGGAAAMGSGIWAMHFTAMTAMSVHMPVSYRLDVTALSVVPGLLGSWVSLRSMSRDSVGWWDIQRSALLMAIGIGTMHYVGMEALVMPATLRYVPSLFVLSIVVAYVLAALALYIRVMVQSMGVRDAVAKPVSAIAMGTAVAGMHYTAMAAARFYPDPNVSMTGAVFTPLTLGLTICIATSAIMGIAILSTIVDQRLGDANAKTHATEIWANAVLDTAADGVISVDAHGIIRSVNRAAAKMFGYAPEEMVGQDIDLVLPDAQKTALALHGTAAHGVYDERTGVRRDATMFPVELASNPLVTEGGALVIASLRDITQRKTLERQLAQAQKLESIGQLAAGIAHEINTPIQFIGDNTRFLEGAFADLQHVLDACGAVLASEPAAAAQRADARAAAERADLPYLRAEIPQAIEQTLDGVRQVAAIVSAMKEFSHPGSKEKHLANLNHAVESTITVSRNEWKYVADVATELDPALPPIPCLVAELNQVLLNIIVNAAQAIAEAQSHQPEPRRGNIRIATRHDDDLVEIRISDDGPGIPESIRTKIFDPFFTTKGVGKGTGQGLAMAYSIVRDKHGGNLFVETATGLGSTFVLQLPRDPGTKPVDTGRCSDSAGR